jgi:hypothetical protein
MELNLEALDFRFAAKPLLIGGRAMEYYGLRKAGVDVDLVISREDHRRLVARYPEHVKDLGGDLGVCELGFEIWNQICGFDYDELRRDAAEEERVLVASPERLLFLKALAIKVPKSKGDIELLVELILRRRSEGR